MGFIDHIHACNNHDLTRFVPFYAPNGQQIGWVRQDKLSLLTGFEKLLEITGQSVSIRPCQDLTAAMAQVTTALRDQGVLENWRDEPYEVKASFAEKPLFLMERAATAFFGIRAFGVHINGYVRRPDGFYMWIAKRAFDRAICPGMLDNMVAGGQPAGLSLMDNIIKECGEEANVPEQLARTTQSVGMISYMMETDGGIKPDVMFCYDLEVPADFIPENTDGEVESFSLMSVEEVAEIVRTSFEFKFNCNLVVIDFLLRHGVIMPDDCADYEALVRGLRQ
ncbi:NUDIX hydrolase family protein [Terasakiella sp. SH-1]|uniref:NUDIX hydrolase n=1 Tax=Terasakiella sp. SH-1 TaxID=2560057 RepID=UPI0010739035|nr:NUDIX hydrolase family protein [Terasakiella sp. SH-1]